MNNCHTIGSLRADVFRVLDEYSRNGENHDIFSGGTADIDRRFITALNGTLCLVTSALGFCEKRTRICFSRPVTLAMICDLCVTDVKQSIDLPVFSGAVSFDYLGGGKLCFVGADEQIVGEKELSCKFGNLESERAFVPENAEKMLFLPDSALLVKNLKIYDKKTLCGCSDEKYLPDGKRLYCAISPLLSEIKAVFAEKRVGKTGIPQDIFEVKDGVISCDEKYAGGYTVEFLEYPESFDESSSPDTVLSLSPAAYEAAVYSVAAALCEREDGELYSRLIYKYRELLENTYPKNNLIRKNSFFAGGVFGRRRRGYAFRR